MGRARAAAAAGALLLAASAAACGGGDGAAEASRSGFAAVPDSGIEFDMEFLPGEQGANFKINLYDHGSGVAVGDFDGDGDDDVYLLNQLGGNGLFRNDGTGRFEDVTERAGVALGDRISTSAAFADYDNDGDQDLFVATTRGGNALFRNDGTGRFEDVSAAAGVELVAHSQGVTFFDYDGDGLLDLYVTNTARWTTGALGPGGRYYEGPETLADLVVSPKEQNVLYRNQGDGTFRDVTSGAGVAGTGWGGDVAVFDHDGDGDLDLFVTNMFGSSTLFRNEGGRRFTDVTEQALGRTSWGGMGTKAFDYDGDGLLDLYLVDMHSDMWMGPRMGPEDMTPERRYPGPEGPMVGLGRMKEEFAAEMRARLGADGDFLFGNALYRNLGGGRFQEVSERAGVETLWPWGVAAADFDLDGDVDVFLPSGMGHPYFFWPNGFLENRGDGTFAQRAAEVGLAEPPGGRFLPEPIGTRDAPKSSRSAAVLDLEGDLRPDLVVNNFNDRPYVYRNQFPARPVVGLRLVGTRSNRDAIGALVRLESGGRVLVRQVHAAGGYLAQDTRTLRFALPEGGAIDRCEIRWPSGAVQTVEGLRPGELNEVREPEGR